MQEFKKKSWKRFAVPAIAIILIVFVLLPNVENISTTLNSIIENGIPISTTTTLTAQNLGSVNMSSGTYSSIGGGHVQNDLIANLLVDFNQYEAWVKSGDLNNFIDSNIYLKKIDGNLWYILSSDSNNPSRLLYSVIANPPDLNVYSKIIDINAYVGTKTNYSDLNFQVSDKNVSEDANRNAIQANAFFGGKFFGDWNGTAIIDSFIQTVSWAKLTNIPNLVFSIIAGRNMDVNANWGSVLITNTQGTADNNSAVKITGTIGSASDINAQYIQLKDTNNISRINSKAIADLNKTHYSQADANNVFPRLNSSNVFSQTNEFDSNVRIKGISPAQLNLTYNSTNDTNFFTRSNGVLQIIPTGKYAILGHYSLDSMSSLPYGDANESFLVNANDENGQSQIAVSVVDGTRNPRAKLFVSDSSDVNQRVWGLWEGYSSGPTPFVIGENQAEWLRITTGGLVGIGTTTPKNTLNVIGDGNFTTKLEVGGGTITAKTTAINKKLLTFDGSNDYITMGSVGQITEVSNVANFSMSIFYYPKSFAHSMFFGSSQVDVNNRVLFGFYDSSNDRLYFYISKAVLAYGYIPSASNVIPLNKWHHIVALYDGTQSPTNANALKVYVNNVQQTLTFASTIPSSTADLSTVIFRLSTTSTNAVEGYMREFSLYNTTLTSANVSTLYQGMDLNAGRMHYWKLNENVGQTAIDTGANPVNGTITETTWSDSNSITINNGFPFTALSFGATTDKNGGISFGNDTTLYRNDINSLKTDGNLTVGKNLIAWGDINGSSNLQIVGSIFYHGALVNYSPLILVSAGANFNAKKMIDSTETSSICWKADDGIWVKEYVHFDDKTKSYGKNYEANSPDCLNKLTTIQDTEKEKECKEKQMVWNADKKTCDKKPEPEPIEGIT